MPVLAPQAGLVLDPLRMNGNAADRANLHTLGLVKMADTFSAFLRVNLIDVSTKVNRIIGTFGLAYITIDALVRDHQSHDDFPIPGSDTAFRVRVLGRLDNHDRHAGRMEHFVGN